MSETTANNANAPDFTWRQAAPRARWVAMALFGWRGPKLTVFLCMLAAAPALVATLYSPALLSFAPTVDMIAPIADARALRQGEIDLIDQQTPFYLLILALADAVTNAPGRAHLLAKALSAGLVALPFAWLAAARFPLLAACGLSALLAAFVASPFSGSAELGLAMLIVCAVVFLMERAEGDAATARCEGLVGGAMLYGLWMLSPVYSLCGFVLLAGCPFMTGRFGLSRYAAALAAFSLIAAAIEWTAPGVNIARASLASGVLTIEDGFAARENIAGLSAAAFSAIMAIAAVAIFGGREHWRAWASAGVFFLLLFCAARLAGASASSVFVFAAAIAVFSVTSPLYDGVFRAHDRASVAVANSCAALALFWMGAHSASAAGQFAMQMRAAAAAPENVRAELALVQPATPMIAEWIEEGRFSTPEARELLALKPVDQAVMLLEAAGQARLLAAQGADVAILTRADTACVLASNRPCRADGAAAASDAKFVFVPRIDLDPASALAKGRAQALLYTEFKMIEQTVFWEIWARRGADAAAELLGPAVETPTAR